MLVLKLPDNSHFIYIQKIKSSVSFSVQHNPYLNHKSYHMPGQLTSKSPTCHLLSHRSTVMRLRSIHVLIVDHYVRTLSASPIDSGSQYVIETAPNAVWRGSDPDFLWTMMNNIWCMQKQLTVFDKLRLSFWPDGTIIGASELSNCSWW